MLFENKYNSMMMMMMMVISVGKLFFHLVSKQHDAHDWNENMLIKNDH
jgi:hypothetical protein